MNYSVRKAALDDVPVLERLISESARILTREDYTESEIEAAIGTAWGVDTQLIRDGTYYVVETEADGIVACGGWSRRKTLFGSDKQQGRESEVLDPRQESARIRAFFVRPNWARRGIGRLLLKRCEDDAKAHGFQSTELVATLTGQRLYRVFGYVGEQRVDYPLPNGTTIQFVPMKKARL
jgi:N-acetylglutamate synthase-like GNAT family acetyltransferase